MADYITIDGGTTNTRVNLVWDGNIIASQKISIGNKDCVNGNGYLKEKIKEGIELVLKDSKLSSRDIKAIIASGMITAKNGLCEIEHITAPAGIAELNLAIEKRIFKDISDIPFYFIPGVKNNSCDIEEADIMRGEETEAMGLASIYGSKYMYVLPGSHSKLIFFDENTRISHCKTLMTGEMLAALSQNTILKDAVDLSQKEYDLSFLLFGFNCAQRLGINEAAFKARILKNLFGKSAAECYSYFLGVILSGEIDAIKRYADKKVLIGGKSQLKNALYDILKEKTDLEVYVIPEKTVDECVALGAVKIFEYK